MSELISKLKQQIVDQLNLADVDPAGIDENAPLFGEGLGLDSIDALELILLFVIITCRMKNFLQQSPS